jgi:Sulfotransferase domain
MALKIIGAGFGRTGTASVCAALNQLGFPSYHMFEVLKNKQNKSHMDFWIKVANGPPGAQHDWEQVFSKYMATVDNPGCCVWRELMVAYPTAKVLLTVHPRGPEAWYDSTLETIYFTESSWQFKLLKLVSPFARKMAAMGELIWQRSHEGTISNRAKAIAHYQQHVEEVKAVVAPERLLIFTADQGWKPLCEFLGVPVPDVPFPNINDRAEFKKRITPIKVAAYTVLGVGAVMVAGLIYGAIEIVF